jgi:formate dehydrogenase major subunit
VERISWDQAINEIGDKMRPSARSRAGLVYWLGSAKFSNEGAYLFRKFAAFWGTNNVDHQARICHSTTVAGVANTWGYGAQTNSYNDIRNSKTMIIMGGNPAEAHPVSLQHVLSGKELNRANMIVIDPRLTRTAAHATEYVRIRPGTDIPVIWGMLAHLQERLGGQGVHRQRVYGMDDVRKEVEKWTPEEVERVTGVPRRAAEARRRDVRQAEALDADLVHGRDAAHGRHGQRARLLHLLLATGNVGGAGTGANIFRGHCNVQGATDLGLDIDAAALLRPRRRRLAALGRVWDVGLRVAGAACRRRSHDDGDAGHSIDALVRRDAAAEGSGRPAGQMKAMIVFGHGGNTVTRMPKAREGIEALELLVVADPHPTTLGRARRAQEQHLPAADLHAVRMRRLAHRVEPLDPVGREDRQADLRVEGRLRGHVSAREEARLRRPDVQEHQGREQSAAVAETSCARSIAAASRPAIAASRRSASRRTCATRTSSTWSRCARQGRRSQAATSTACPGRAGARRSSSIPARHILYNTNLHVKDGGGTFRARFGVEREEKLDGTTRKVCWPTAPTRRAPRSRTAIPSSPTAC